MNMENEVDENELEFFSNGVSVEEAVPTKNIRKCTTKRKKIEDNSEEESEEEFEDDEDSSGDSDYEMESDDNVEYNYRSCDHCDHFAKSYGHLDRHMFQVHVDQRLCNECEHLSETYKDYIEHNRTHTNTCEVCNKKLLGITALRNHEKTHKKRPVLKEIKSTKVPCNICGKLFKDNSNLKIHLHSVHSKEVHKCNVCEFTTNTKVKLEVHRRSHFKEMSICPECGKSVKSLSKHFRRNCSGKTKYHKCNLCEKTFKEKDKLTTHIKRVHDKIKNIQCQLCEYKTYSNSNLKLHVSKMHTKEDLTKICSVCDQKTMSLDHHMKIYHFEAYLKNKASIETQ